MGREPAERDKNKRGIDWLDTRFCLTGGGVPIEITP